MPQKRSLIITALVSFVLFIYLAFDISVQGPLSLLDPRLSSAVISCRNGVLTPLAFAFTHLGSILGLLPLGLVVVILLVVRGKRHWAGWFFLVNALGYFVSHGAKLLFARERPSTALLLAKPETTFSFPSGHAFSAAVFFGALALLIAASIRHQSWRIAAVVVCVFVALFIGLSRVYLAYHWPTDVLAGWSLGLAWISLAGLYVTIARRENPTDARLRTDQSMPS